MASHSHKRSASLGVIPFLKRERDEEPSQKYRRLSSPWLRLKDTPRRSIQNADIKKEGHEFQVKEESVLPEPMFLRHQLIGDSLLLRFAEQILYDRCKHEDGLRFLGLCVSGQTIRELKNRVKNKFAPVAKKIVLLIGTNDMLRFAEVEDMIMDIQVLMSYLKSYAEKIVILTLPPVPKLVDNPTYQERLTGYNDYLVSLHDGESVFVIKITRLFLKDGECNLDCFERFYDWNQQRPDLIHLNRKGLLLVCDHLRGHKYIKEK